MAVTPEEIAHFWSEWTDDNAPLRERAEYTQAAVAFLAKYEVKEQPPVIVKSSIFID